MAHAVLIPRCPRLCSLFSHPVSLRAKRGRENIFLVDEDMFSV